MRSFAAAFEAGADAIETDVRLSSDGRVVIFHDEDGARTCGRPELLRRTPWDEVRTWDAGEGEHPVLLSDVLETWPDRFVNVDVKDGDPDAALATLQVLRRQERTGAVGLGSFHHAAVRALRRGGWSGQLALSPREVALTRFLPVPASRALVRGSAAQIPTHEGRIRLDAAWFVSRMHRLGLRVDYWTIDDPAEAVRLVQRGADGIVTNDPAAIAAALGRGQHGVGSD
ncbi:MAG: hypothetical protein KTR31_23370 [Myxococcales bacterium]|nr:hypothetical protein [Myxococcales bacterium]